MHLKTAVLLTALAASSATARLHGHERRHAHHQEKRAVGDTVVVTMNGEVVSWANDYGGKGGKPAPTPAPAPENKGTYHEAIQNLGEQSKDTGDAPKDTPAGGSGGDGSNWAQTLGDYIRDGFGIDTSAAGDNIKAAAAGDGNTNDPIYYTGNVGKPWGSNIIEVPAGDAHKYRHVMKIDNPNDKPWLVVFWNKMGPDGLMTGWFGNSALSLTVEPNVPRYVALDNNSQGGFGAAEGDSLPTDQWGGYSCTWGEFDFSNLSNKGWSGWDVSAIQAMNAGQYVQGMKICDSEGNGCSSITSGCGEVVDAYTNDLADVDGIGGKSPSDTSRLVVTLGYDG